MCKIDFFKELVLVFSLCALFQLDISRTCESPSAICILICICTLIDLKTILKKTFTVLGLEYCELYLSW